MEIATKRSTNMGPFFLGFILGSISSYVYRWYQNRDETQTTDRPCGAGTRPPRTRKHVNESISQVPDAWLFREVTSSGSAGTCVSAKEQYELLENLSYLISCPFAKAKDVLRSKGYDVQILRVNDNGTTQTLPRTQQRTASVLGVEIEDPAFNFQTKIPSVSAKVTALSTAVRA